jgi:glycosyltransferase involved in cell wall biosynthesis
VTSEAGSIDLPAPQGHATGEPLFGRIFLLVTEDWFVLSHFKPLLAVLKEFAQEVSVVTRSSGRFSEIEALGVRVIDFDYQRSSTNPLRELATVAKLTRLLKAEKPDVVHLVAMKSIVLGSASASLAGLQRVVVHITGLGLLGVTTRPLLRLYRTMSMRLIGHVLRRSSSCLLVENPDDLAFLRTQGVDPGPRFSVVPGAGVDPDVFPEQAQPVNAVPLAAFVGRMIRSKGVEVLMQALERLEAQGVPLRLALYGPSDSHNPEAVSPEVLRAWCGKHDAQWPGATSDVRGVWRDADIFVLPALGGDGMPRAMLEAAASGRPLVVSDVPGCRNFVRDGIEGFVVPPDDAPALAGALRRLAGDRGLRERMGTAARRRLLDGFTEAHVKEQLRSAYRRLAQMR